VAFEIGKIGNIDTASCVVWRMAEGAMPTSGASFQRETHILHRQRISSPGA
jgi:hypothetical protein